MMGGGNPDGFPDEKELIEAARNGKVAAYTQLVERYQEAMIRLAFTFLSNWEDAREAAQDAFVKAYGALGNFRSESRFSTWLYRILANHCKDQLRKRKIRQHLIFWQPKEAGEPEPQAVIHRHAQHDLLNDELGEGIQDAMQELPVQQRSVFAMRYFEDMSLEQIAEALQLSTGAVKAHLWQAGQKMKKRLSLYMKTGEL